MYLSLLIMLIAKANGIIIPNYCWIIWGVVLVMQTVNNIVERKREED